MDYERITENLVRLAIEQYKLQKEYQTFLDLLPQTIDFDTQTKDDNSFEKFRLLLDSLIEL